MKSSLTGVTGRGSRFPGQSTMQFASVVNRSRNLPISQCYQLTYCLLASSLPLASAVENTEYQNRKYVEGHANSFSVVRLSAQEENKLRDLHYVHFG